MARILPAIVFGSVLLFSHYAQTEEEKVWTEFGLYGFATFIEGDTRIADVEVDLEVTPKDILDNLDVGGMGFFEHRRNTWSFIGDVAYMNLNSKNTVAKTSMASVTLDATFKQFISEGFVGYRFDELIMTGGDLGFDILGGARYTSLKMRLGAEASALGLTTAASRKKKENWVDGVVAIRAQYNSNNGWGASGWLDVGAGVESHSAQLIGLVSHHFENNIKLFGGYRYLYLNYETGSGSDTFELNAHYHGPLIGVSYRF